MARNLGDLIGAINASKAMPTSSMALDSGRSQSSGVASANKQPGSSINMSTLGKMPTYTPPPAGSMVKQPSAPKTPININKGGSGLRVGGMLGGGGGMGLGRID